MLDGYVEKNDKENSIENLHKDNESENDIKLKIINGEINEENKDPYIQSHFLMRSLFQMHG